MFGGQIDTRSARNKPVLAISVQRRVRFGVLEERMTWKQAVETIVEIGESSPRIKEGTRADTRQRVHGDLPFFALARVATPEPSYRLDQQVRDLGKTHGPESGFRFRGEYAC